MSEKNEDGEFESSPDSREDYKSNKIGPTISQKAPAMGGPREDLEWTFSAGISEFSQSPNHEDSGVVDDAFEANLEESSPSKPSTMTKGKKAKKKGKKVKKKKKGKNSKTNKPALYFHTRNPTVSNSSVPGGASEISAPRYRKNTPHKNPKSVSPQDRSSKNYASGSYDHEGGSRGTFTNLRSSQNEQFWSPSPTHRRRVGFFGPERTHHLYTKNRGNMQSPFKRD